MTPPEGLVAVRTYSHRARARLARLTPVTSRFAWVGAGTTHYDYIDPAMLDEALTIKGVKRCRQPADVNIPW